MVGIHVLRFAPTQRGHGGGGLGPQIVRAAIDDDVLAVGFAPDRMNFKSGRVGETVAAARSVFVDGRKTGARQTADVG